MENELAKRETGGQSFIERLIENTDSLEKVKEVGMVIINSGFCPQHFKDSKDAVGAIMCIEAGRKLGLSWMQSLSDIYPVKGRIGIMGTAAKAVIFSSGVLESWKEWTEGEYPQKTYKHITESKRKGLPDVFRTEFSVYDAEMAGLMGKDIYKKYGKRMIAWRDIGFHASDYYQDILKGMKTVEELNDYDGLVPGSPEKIVLKTEDGKEITFTDKDKEHSKKTTSRVADKIKTSGFGIVNPENTNIQEAVIVKDAEIIKNANDEAGQTATTDDSPFIPERGSHSSDDNKPNDAPVEDKPEVPGSYTLVGLEKLDTEVLKKIVMEDMDMLESSEIIGGKNTKKKLAEIIMAHQEGRLDTHVAPYLKANEERQKAFDASQEKNAVSTTPLANAQTGEIGINRGFDAPAEQKGTPTKNADLLQADKPKVDAGNKYSIDIPVEVPREFSVQKSLFNKLMGIDPQITTPRFMELVTKIGLQAKFADKEGFLKLASVAEINQLLDAN